MIERLVLEQIHYRAGGPGADIGAAKNHPPDARVDYRARAHRTRFLCHVKIAVSQAPVADSGLSRGQRQHFGVGGRIFEQLDLIVRARDNFLFPNNNRADWNFVSGARFRRQA